MRQIIFDTETTGMNKSSADKAEGHRIIELGCVELIDRQATGRTLHLYFNPEQEVDPEAVAVHGLDNARLAKEPTIGEKWAEIEAFLDGADELIAHNASFDCQFLNRELALAKKGYRIEDKFNIIDTLAIAKQQFPAQRNNLDALCKRFNIDNSGREKHGALLDSELLLEVYLKLTGGQSSLFAAAVDNPSGAQKSAAKNKTAAAITAATESTISSPSAAAQWLAASASDAEIAAHQAIMEKIRK